MKLHKILVIITIVILAILMIEKVSAYGAQDSNPSVDLGNKDFTMGGAAVSQDEATKNRIEQSNYDAIQKEKQKKESTGVLGSQSASTSHTSDEIVGEAQDFINKGKGEGAAIDESNLKKASNTLFNILLTIGIILSVLIGSYLGVKFMLASAEDKAKVKESLVPFVAGCIIIFGAFTIWALTINLLSGIDKVGKNSYNIEYKVA